MIASQVFSFGNPSARSRGCRAIKNDLDFNLSVYSSLLLLKAVNYYAKEFHHRCFP